mgnify:CR=1 FL=1
MPNTTSSEFGDIVLVAFPFTDQIRQKKRPAVVVSTRAYNDARPDLILIGITSRIRTPAGFAEVTLSDWQGAGLIKPSAIKPVVFTVEKNLILKTLGQLGKQDQLALHAMLSDIIHLSD